MAAAGEPDALGGTAIALVGLAPAPTRHLFHRVIPGRSFLLQGASVASFVLLTIPWSGYQHYVDPPGNRLLKWHLAGVVGIDPRGVGETLRDSYSQLKPCLQLVDKLGNLQALFVEDKLPNSQSPESILGDLGPRFVAHDPGRGDNRRSRECAQGPVLRVGGQCRLDAARPAPANAVFSS